MIDTHAHIDQLNDIDASLKRAKEQGVTDVVAVSVDVESSKKNLEISLKEYDSYPNVHLAFGVHPSEASREELDNCTELIKQYSSSLSAIGEIGLDFWYKWVRRDQEKKDEQIEVYKSLLELSKELDLPPVIHSRGAWRKCFDFVKELDIKKALFHWYSGPIDVLDDILNAGYYVSATPSLSYSKEAVCAIKYAPIERILIETDTPVFYRNKGADDKSDGYVSEPKDVFNTLKFLSDIKEKDQELVSLIVNNNAKEFFNLGDN